MFNKNKIKEHIIKAIKIMPTSVVLKRIILIPDGMNGFVNEGYKPTTVAEFDGLLDDGSATRTSGNNQTVTDGGNKETITKITIMCPSEDIEGKPFNILNGDFFTVNDVTYKVVQPNFVYQIYWLCTLEVAV